MITTHAANMIAVFLCTYLMHSTLLQGPVWWMTTRRHWPGNPELRSLLLKGSLLAPLLTQLLVTGMGGLHWGFQLPLADFGDTILSDDHSTHVIGPSPALAEPDPDSVRAKSLESTSSEFIVQNDHTAARSALNEALKSVATAQSVPASSSFSGRQRYVSAGVILWFLVAIAGLVRLIMQWTTLRRLRMAATAIVSQEKLNELKQLRSRLGIRRNVALLQSQQTAVPLAAGILHPFVVFPTNTVGSRSRGSGSEFSAILSHELAHVARRDALWNLLLQIICRVGFFQPLNWLTSRSIRQQMDFCADSMAAEVLGERMSLVRCLYDFGKRLNGRSAASSSVVALASGMAVFHSALGQRVDALLNSNQHPTRPTLLIKLTVLTLTLLVAILVSLFGPCAVVEAAPSSHSSSDDRNENMNNSLASLLVLAGLSMPATADEPKATTDDARDKATPLKSTPDELPTGIRKFNGMLVGRVAAKDPEQGTFTVLVDAVPRVWRNSQAEKPRSIVGKTITVSGVFGKFLDVLVVTRIGETIEFECKHDGDGLVFPGELLRKVAPYDPADYPVLPEEFRGFRGQVAAAILKKDPETFELIIRVDRVLKTWEENGAKKSKSIEGKSLMLAGFWNRREAYYNLKVGDKIEVGMRHIGRRSDHLTVAEEIKRTKTRDGDKDRAMARREEMASREPQRGFRGMLVGRLVEKDAERGTFTVTVDAVPRVWENNKSANPKSLVGRKVTAEGVTGRMIDALVVTKIGDTIEFGALHDDGPRVRLGEVLRKVAPVKPGDYPVLPDSFRGFRGMVTAKVIRKGDELWELIVKVEKVHETFDGNRAEQPRSIIGKELMLAGFWNRKDEFYNIRVGERIRCRMNHTQRLSDHMTVVEGIRKVKDKGENE